MGAGHNAWGRGARLAYPRPLVRGRFRYRANRFLARVEVEGREIEAHVPSSGRMRELLQPGAEVFLLPAGKSGRKTAYSLALAAQNGVLVSVDASLPNRLVEAALPGSRFPGMGEVQNLKREPVLGAGRSDFRLETGEGTWFLEVKSVTLVQEGVAMFPDAPTVRGRRHLEELGHLPRGSRGAAVLFVVQRDDARVFRPHWEADPEFGRALETANQAGVQLLAWYCRVDLEGVSLGDRLPVELRTP